MIRLKPTPDAVHKCPRCRQKLAARSWLIPGMRSLGEFHCPACGGEFYGDLPSGQGLHTPILLDKSSGEIYDDYNAAWFSGWLFESYARRTSEPIGFEIKKFSATKTKVVLLNCLDALYGHSLLKLLNAQYYIDQADISLIVLLPSFLEWMLPDGAAEAWIVDLPLNRGTEWNDFLADEIKRRLEPFAEVFLSVGFSHPHANDFQIERFTRIEPFPLENWKEKLAAPRVTFIWRDDRLWKNEEALNSLGFGQIRNRFGVSRKQNEAQSNKVIEFAETLRKRIPSLDFAVAGIGNAGGLPSWILDLRLKTIDAEAERRWCRRYAESQIVVGVHGSNMLLPSAHAGAVIELIGEDRQGNFLQDILFRHSDYREMFFRYRFVPPSTSAASLARLAATMLCYEDFRRLMSPEFCSHAKTSDFSRWLSAKNEE